MGVAICLYPPSDWDGLRFSSLEPERQTFYAYKNGTITLQQAEKLYYEQVLSKLNPQEIYNKLKNNVLLCWEEDRNMCHRSWVAKWLEKELNIHVPEWDLQDEKILNKNSNPLF
jgi:hypothetical protein